MARIQGLRCGPCGTGAATPATGAAGPLGAAADVASSSTAATTSAYGLQEFPAGFGPPGGAGQGAGFPGFPGAGGGGHGDGPPGPHRSGNAPGRCHCPCVEGLFNGPCHGPRAAQLVQDVARMRTDVNALQALVSQSASNTANTSAGVTASTSPASFLHQFQTPPGIPGDAQGPSHGLPGAPHGPAGAPGHFPQGHAGAHGCPQGPSGVPGHAGVSPPEYALPLHMGPLGVLAHGKLFDDRVTAQEEFKFSGHKGGDTWKGKVERYVISKVPASTNSWSGPSAARARSTRTSTSRRSGTTCTSTSSGTRRRP